MQIQNSFVAVFLCYQPVLKEFKFASTPIDNYTDAMPSNCHEDIQELIETFKENEKSTIAVIGEPVDVIEIIDSEGNSLWNESNDYVDMNYFSSDMFCE